MSDREPSPSPTTESPIFLFRIIWAVMFLTGFLFIGIFFLQPHEGAALTLQFRSEDFLRNVRESPLPYFKLFTVIGVGNTALAILLPKLLLKWKMKTDAALELRDYFVPFIVRLALLDSVITLGFALGFALTQELNDYLPFAMVGQFFFLRYVPLSEEKVRRDLDPFPNAGRVGAIRS